MNSMDLSEDSIHAVGTLCAVAVRAAAVEMGTDDLST